MPLQAEPGLSSIPYMTVILNCHTEDQSLPTLMTECGGHTIYSLSLYLSSPLESSSSCSRDSEVCLPPHRRITFSSILTFCDEKQLFAFNKDEFTPAMGDTTGYLQWLLCKTVSHVLTHCVLAFSLNMTYGSRYLAPTQESIHGCSSVF